MMLKTTAYKKIKNLEKRIRLVAGGTSASKTVSVLMWLIVLAQHDETPTLTSVVSESFPHLRRGAMRDFKAILEAQDDFYEDQWNKTDYIYTLQNGSQIEFFSADQPAKVRGPRRDRLFLNEANNIPYETADQLIIRTNDFVFADWNPVNEFWAYTELIGKREDVDFLTLTYLDNEALNENIVKEIEMHRGNRQWWTVYGLGQLGAIESRIYTGWKIDLEVIPQEAKLMRKGLDFGYSNDPTALVDIYYYNGGYILDEVVYQKGLSNKQIYDVSLNSKKALTIADSAEPKSIAELREYGMLILPVTKGADSVNQGIQYVQEQQISVTKRSVNIIKEYRNYTWETDKDGKIINEPIGIWNHAMDAIRYGFSSLKPPKATKPHVQKPFESSDPYSKPKQEEKVEDNKPMRKPDSWGPKTRYQQAGYESSDPFNVV
jgi:phage terminase large subunit